MVGWSQEGENRAEDVAHSQNEEVKRNWKDLLYKKAGVIAGAEVLELPNTGNRAQRRRESSA